MMSVQAENQPVAIKSSWIQRLKPSSSSRENLEGELQIPLRNLALADSSQEFVRRIIPERPRGFGSFRVKVSGVNFRKPPLPPASKSHKTPDDNRLKSAHKTLVDNQLRLHGVDIRLERHHQETGTRPKDLLAEFASRLDIKEKPTPVGMFHVADRKVAKKKNTNARKEKLLVNAGLTPVIAPKGSLNFSFTASLPHQQFLRNQPSSRASAVAGSGTINFFLKGNQSSSQNALESACCASSPSPVSQETPEESAINCTEEPNKVCTPADQEVQELIGGKRSNGFADRLVPVKRTRLSVEGKSTRETPAPVCPWLNRWSITGVPKAPEANKLNPQKLPGEQNAAAPSAAAMAIVGATMRLRQASH